MLLEGAEQGADRVGVELDVVVQEQDDRLVQVAEDPVERGQRRGSAGGRPAPRAIGPATSSQRAVGRAVVDDRDGAGDGRPPGRLDHRGQALGQEVPAVVVEHQDVRAVDRQGFHPSD